MKGLPMPFTDAAVKWAREGDGSEVGMVTRLAAACLDEWLAVHGVRHKWDAKGAVHVMDVLGKRVMVAPSYGKGKPADFPSAELFAGDAEWFAWFHYQTDANTMLFMGATADGKQFVAPLSWRNSMQGKGPHDRR